jgi:two-component system, sensor histidine kinase and response regulator
MTDATSKTGRIHVAAKNEHARLVARISHEIRTPMFGVIGSAELLEKTSLSEEQRLYTRTITLSANALMDIVNDILDISRIEDGTLEITHESCDLFALLQEIVREYCLQLKHRNVEMIFSFPATVPRNVKCDRTRVRQICINLIANAAQFTSTGYVYISVEWEHAKGYHIRIKDTGAGIPEDEQDTLLDVYSGGIQNTTDRVKGSGLGIAISRQLTTLMGGTFTLTSSANEHTEFNVTLPLSVEETQPKLPHVSKPDSLSVLLVHSVDKAREVYGNWLRTFGIVCETASTAEEAIAKQQKAEREGIMYDAIIANDHLDDMHGETLAWALSQSDQRGESGKSFILLTAMQDDSELERMRCVGVTALVMKPIVPLSLVKAVAPGSVESVPVYTTLPPDAKKISHVKAAALVVEDNAINRTVATALLRKLGCVVEYAENGEECLAMLEKRSYDIVFMDCRMPVMDGYEATRRIREKEVEGTHVPIIAVTANVMKGDQQKCLEAGMDDYVPKPIRADDIESVLHRWIIPM